MPVDNNSTAAKPGLRLRELGLVLPKAPMPLGAYVEASEVGSLLFLSGMLPVVNGKLPITGRLGENLSVEQGREAVRIAAMNALAVAQQHLGDLDRLKKLVKLSVVLATTEQFVEHAAVADGASNLFVQLFGSENGHVRTVYGVQSLPIGAVPLSYPHFRMAGKITSANAFGTPTPDHGPKSGLKTVLQPTRCAVIWCLKQHLSRITPIWHEHPKKAESLVSRRNRF
jgi:enamine deaminase RidA (YjgF/YER057c/UK114 family)